MITKIPEFIDVTKCEIMLIEFTNAFFHHFGTMTHTPGIGNFSVKMQKMGNF